VRTPLLTVSVFLAASVLHAQAPAKPARQVQTPSPAAPALGVAGPDFRLGADDQVTVSVLQAPELNTVARVSEQGFVSLPLLGPVRAAGLSAVQLEQAVEALLDAKYIRNPDVTVQVTDVRSRAVSIIGAVQHPGIVQVDDAATLLGVLSLSGGLTEDAGDSVLVLHRGDTAPTEIPLKPLLEGRDGRLNVPVRAGDAITVRQADIVYVVGAVNKPGAFAVRGNARLTVLRALAMGEGLNPTAEKSGAVVVRTGRDGERTEIKVDLGSLLKGRTPDVTLQAHDVLFVPTSGGKVAARTTLDAVVRILSFRFY
jgi:polysaccharide biosynthesis/export protein